MNQANPNQTVMYQLTETSSYMMSFVIVTKENHVIVIDGGRREDMPLLKQYIGGRHISAWILTHAHDDHISGFVSEWEDFKLITPNTSILFLGDLGPEGGDELYWESRHLLKADMVQMAHHGHMNCGMEVYAAIQPRACLWCCPEWLYEEPELPSYLASYEKAKRMKRMRMYGTAVTRKWMEQLGVEKHYVTKDGTNEILL